MIVSLALVAGCSGSDAAKPTDMKAACARLRDVGNEILKLQADGSDTQKSAVRRAVEAFDEAARASDDAELAKQANITLTGFRVYLKGRGIDAEEGGHKATIAIDRAGKRCIESGTVKTLPTQPR